MAGLLFLAAGSAAAELPAVRAGSEIAYPPFCIVDSLRRADGFSVELLRKSLLNEGLALVIADGTFRRLHAKWFAAMELPSDRRIIIGGDSAFPPYEYLNAEGLPEGFAVDLSRAIAREMGMDIEIRLTPWNQAVHALETGEIDVLQGMFYSEERSQRFDFTVPHAYQHYVSVVRTGFGAAPESFDALQGLSLAVQKKDLIHDQLVERGFSGPLLTVESQEAVLKAVAEGRADCGLVMRLSAVRILDGYRMPVVLAKKPMYSAEYCMAVRKGNTALLTQLNEGLRLLQESGEYRRIQEKWLGVLYETPPYRQVVARYLAWIVGPILAVFALVSLWIRLLRRVVASQTASLKESESSYQMLFEQMLNGFALHEMVYDAQGRPADYRFLDVNPAFERMTGLRKRDIQGKTVLDVMPDTERHWIETYGRIVQTGEPKLFENHAATLDKYFEVAAFRTAPNRFATIFSDTTERKRSALRIEHLNRVLRAVRDINQLIVRERNREPLIREACRLMVDYRGYVSAMVILTGETGTVEAWAADGIAAQSDAMRATLDRGELPACCDLARVTADGLVVEDRKLICGDCPLVQPCVDTRSVIMRLVCEDRNYGYLVVTIDGSQSLDEEERSLLMEAAGDLGYALHNMDVEAARMESERQRDQLQAQLNQAQKMEAVGRLAGGVAHDFNNLLMAILGYIDLARELLPEDHPAREDLDEATKSAHRSANLTRQLLAFARRQIVAPKLLDINDTIASMLKLLQRLLGEDIDIVWMPGRDAAPITIDPAQVDQVLANLCVNARDAIAGVGKLTIETENATIDAAYCERHAEALPGDYVMVGVSDSGCGIPRDSMEQIFEPFYTTKEVGRGTGLGLATVYGIVKQNRGFINVYSEVGQGTTFKIYLPMTKGADAIVPSEEPIAPPVGGTETLLLVEDEASIRMSAERYLQSMGYTVLACATPKEALQQASSQTAPIPLLITDVVMPGMNGRELSNRLRKLRPDIKTLFMSGYTANVIAHQGVLDDDANFLQKPITMASLSVKIRAMLDTG